MKKTMHFLLLSDLHKGADWALLAGRVFVGSFLIWGVWDNIVSAARMDEFVGFLKQHGFVMPELLARLSVWAQFFCGVTFFLGLTTRWAGLICAFNFIVALWMVDAQNGLRAAFPAAMLVCFGIIMATIGAGAIAVDQLLSKRR